MSSASTFDLEALYRESPLYRAVSGYVGRRPARFHTPGHKGGRSPLDGLFGQALPLDVTELPETDSLYEASGAILQAERLAAEAYGANATLFSAGGATLCIQAMLRLLALSGIKQVVCSRVIHRSAVNAMALLGLEPVWVWPRRAAGESLPGETDARDVEAALRQNPGSAVYITSPDYFGRLSDTAAIARVCKAHGTPLIVDNAHGSHLAWIDGGALHPVRQGADMCCDSGHKTLPVLTGGAYLHLGGWADPQDARDAMALFGSTSPSYLIMLSLDIARAWAQKNGVSAFERLRGRVEALRALCASLGYGLPQGVVDPVRLTVDTAARGLDGRRAAGLLRAQGVGVEMCDDRHIVLLPAPFNTEDDFKRLETALRRLPEGHPLPLAAEAYERPQRAMPLRQAVASPRRTVAVGDAAGEIAAECRCPCPPGVPLVMPGERISADLAKVLKTYGVGYIKVVNYK